MCIAVVLAADFLGLFSKLNNQDWLLFFSFFSWVVELDQLGEGVKYHRA